MTVEIWSKYTVGNKVPWNAPYGMETVTITKVLFNDIARRFYYEVKEYSFTLNEEELG